MVVWRSFGRFRALLEFLLQPRREGQPGLSWRQEARNLSRGLVALHVLQLSAAEVVPMGIYTLLNLGAAGVMQGWAIPMATDIAFAMGIFGFFRNRMPPSVPEAPRARGA